MQTRTSPGRFATRMAGVRRSCVREIMKSAAADTISFAGGLPSPWLFPVEAISAAAARVFSSAGREALQYTSTEGYPLLRRYVAERVLAPRGIVAQPDDVILTSGSQQALDLVGKVFLDPLDVVCMESPGYLAAIQAFGMYQPTFVTAPMREDGLDVETLERRLGDRRPTLVYAVPNFQNPTGHSYAPESRRRLAEFVAARGAVLVEDDPYGELRFEGEAAPPVAAYGPCARVLVGTFSKVLAPGIRMGWMCASSEIVERLTLAKQGSDLCSNYLTQRILYQYLCDYPLDEHVSRLRAAYRAQRDLMLELLERHFPPEVSWTRPHGGMFVWVTLPPGASANRLLARTMARGVSFAPGGSFFADEDRDDALRLNFTHAAPAEMARGVEILARELTDMLEGEHPAPRAAS